MKKFILLSLLLVAACKGPLNQVEVIDPPNEIYRLHFYPDTKLPDSGLTDDVNRNHLCPAGFVVVSNNSEKYRESRLIPGDQTYQESVIKCK